MRFQWSPNGAFLYDRLLELLIYQERHNNLIVEAVFNELIKETMREQVQVEAEARIDPLRSAVDVVMRNLDSDLARGGVEFDLMPYVSNCESRLRYASREIAALVQSSVWEGDRSTSVEPLMTVRGILYRITSLSIGSQLNGLLGFSLDGSMLDLHELQERYGLDSDSFPMTLPIDELLFVLDFGSVLVNLQDFPATQWSSAKAHMTEILNYLVAR